MSLLYIECIILSPESRCVWTWRVKMWPEKSKRSSRALTWRLTIGVAAGEINTLFSKDSCKYTYNVFNSLCKNTLIAPVSNPVETVVVLDAGLRRCKRKSLCVQTDLLASGACLYNFDTRLCCEWHLPQGQTCVDKLTPLLPVAAWLVSATPPCPLTSWRKTSRRPSRRWWTKSRWWVWLDVFSFPWTGSESTITSGTISGIYASYFLFFALCCCAGCR